MRTLSPKSWFHEERGGTNSAWEKYKTFSPKNFDVSKKYCFWYKVRDPDSRLVVKIRDINFDGWGKKKEAQDKKQKTNGCGLFDKTLKRTLVRDKTKKNSLLLIPYFLISFSLLRDYDWVKAAHKTIYPRPDKTHILVFIFST